MSSRYPDIEICFKPGVPPDGLRPAVWHAVAEVAILFNAMGISVLDITSTTDGQHMAGSRHYLGLAVDIRTWKVPNVQKLAASLRAVLGPSYDVVVEETHLHVEFDPAP
jgi:hypothetical protein